MNGLGSAVETKVSQAIGPDSNVCWAKNFYDFTDICQKMPWHSVQDNSVLKR